MKSTFSVLFFVKKDKQKINGSYPIFVRITVDGVASRFNSKLDVQPKVWDGKAGKAAGRSAEKEGFEPPEPLSSTVFKTAAIDHSAISPCL